MKCLNDRFDNNEERLYCIGCTPPDSEFIVSLLDPELSRFLNKRGFKILHQNVNGVCGKLDNIQSFLSDSKNSVHIFSLSETHTNATIKNPEIQIPGYTLERKDRENGRHGGVSMYIREDVKYRRRSDLEISGIEFLWIEIIIPKSKSILMCSAYRPPDASKFLDKNFIEKFNNMLDNISAEDKETIMCGDFNIDYKVPRDHSNLKDLIKLYGYNQLIKTFTRIAKQSKTLIDLIFTTDKYKIADTIVYTNSTSDHSLIGINRKMNCKR